MNTLQQINYMQTNHAFMYSHDPKTIFDPRKKKKLICINKNDSVRNPAF